jgi:extradiol dioxygenase family protein
VAERFEPTEEQIEAVDRVARFLVRFGMTVPAVLAIESMRPLGFVGSQFMHLLTPSIGVFLTTDQWNALASLLEKRRGVDVILDRIELIDAQRHIDPERRAG